MLCVFRTCFDALSGPYRIPLHFIYTLYISRYFQIQSFQHIYIYAKSADFAIAHLRARTFALSPKSINNNETYADMTNCLLRNS